MSDYVDFSDIAIDSMDLNNTEYLDAMVGDRDIEVDTRFASICDELDFNVRKNLRILRFHWRQGDSFPLTIEGFKSRMYVLFAGAVKYNLSNEMFDIFYRNRWVRDPGNHIVHYMGETTWKSLHQELHIIRKNKVNDKMIPEFEKYIAQMSLAFKKDSTYRDFHHIHRKRIAIEEEQYDADLRYIMCNNGRVDLELGACNFDNSKRMLNRKYVDSFFIPPDEYKDRFRSSRLRSFLKEITCYDNELETYLQSFMGYCLTGLCTEQKVTIISGNGSNGKLFFEVIQEVFNDYATTASDTSFSTGRRGRVRSDIVSWKGLRFIFIDETNKNFIIDEALLKRASGGNKVEAQVHGKQEEKFKLDANLIFITNHKLRLSASKSIFRRLNVIPFLMELKEEDKEVGLLDRLVSEQDILFTWVVLGARDYYQSKRLPNCKAVEEATETYKRELLTNDIRDIKSIGSVSDFIESECELDPNSVIKRKTLQDRYKEWCNSKGLKYLLPSDFKNQLLKYEKDNHKVEEITTHNHNYRYKGLAFKTPPALF